MTIIETNQLDLMEKENLRVVIKECIEKWFVSNAEHLQVDTACVEEDDDGVGLVITLGTHT